MLRLVLPFLMFLLAAVGPARADYDPPGLATDAAGYAESLKRKAAPQPQPAARDKALAEARAAVGRGDGPAAVAAFERAVPLGADGPAFWLELSDAWMVGAKPNRNRARHAAYLAYSGTQEVKPRLEALWRLAELFREDRPAASLTALQWLEYHANNSGEGQLLDAYAGFKEKIAGLKQIVGLQPGRLTVNTDDSQPRACIAFDEELSTRANLRYEDFLSVTPAVPLAASPRGKELCVTGFAYGASYELTLRQGIPGTEGRVLKSDVKRSVRIGDRAPSVAFRSGTYILPRLSGDGIPVTAVNIDRADVRVYRLEERGLAQTLRANPMFSNLTQWEGSQIEDETGELLWSGTIDVPPAARNSEVSVALPFRKAVPDPKPGVYLVTVEPADVPDSDRPYSRATQWVVLTDIALTVMEGEDGVTVFSRSIDTAKPLPGVEVSLIARNNGELGRATSDADGRVQFPAGLARGTGGRQPMLVTAVAGADFAMLNLLGPAFDLRDRGVAGRSMPGPMDAYLYTDRGVYRQGETVNLTVLLRDDRTAAIEGLPLTVKVLRPSGTEYRSTVVTAGPGGGVSLPLALSRTAQLGGWTVNVHADPKAPPIGTVEFQVDDFVPERLAVELAPQVPFLVPGAEAEVLAKARFLYGPPAAGLTGTAELALDVDTAPYPQHPGYRFGLVQESFNRTVSDLTLPTTDATGEARIAVTVPPLPDTTRPLRATVSVAVSEPGGRPTRKSVSVPVRARAFAIGVHPRFEGSRVAENQELSFDVLAVAPDGARMAKPGLSWELIEERVSFTWFYSSGRYTYRVNRRDSSLKAGSVDAAAGGPALLTLAGLPYGRYRLEVADKASGVATSVRFTAGWQPPADASDRPDELEITSDKEQYKPGETARLKIAPPFAGEVLLTVATDRVLSSRSFSVPAAGTTVEVPVSADWGPGAYVTATVLRPPVKGRDRQPVRAIGLKWLTVDPAERTLGLTIEAPQVVRPRQPVEVAVRVAQPGPAEEVYVTLAAVDEGILQLTRFQSPDPADHYFGQRRLGVEIRDDYGRLIDPLNGPVGALRQGGDSGVALPVVPFTVASLFKGPVKVGADGVARITLDLPDFTGELRLMAVAFSKTRMGSSARPMTVRDTLVADAALPRFLAPGDESQLTINLHNVEAAAGAYTVRAEGSGAVAVEDGVLTLGLPAGERRTLVMPLKGTSVGIGHVALSVSGPGGLSIAHGYDITVRPARTRETLFTTSQLQPGAQSTIAAPMLAAYLPGTGALTASYSVGAPFDVGGILAALDRYPFGCLEQTVSRALPLLYVRDVELVFGAERKPDETLDGRIDQAVARTLDKQRYDGTFGLWGPNSPGETWLTAYAMEFLVRARAKGHDVPDTALREGLDWLRQHAVDGGTDNEALASRAYALHVLALAGVATPSPVRYFHDGFLAKLPTPLAKAQVGAALARLGDKERATGAFRAAVERLARDPWHPDYGSTVRDAAAIAALAADVDMTAGILPALLDRLPATATAAQLTNTQEQAWLVLAAEALGRGLQPPKVTVGGRAAAPSGGRVNVVPSAVDLRGGVTVANAGSAALWQAVSVSGVPVEPRPAAREGLRVKRGFFTRTGAPYNLDQIKQNDVFVIVLEGEASTKLFHQAVVTHPLPAGWEIENVRLGSGENSGMAWLGELTEAQSIEGRDDRYVAAVDLTEEAPTFKLAYLVRAVTPGTYELPGAVLEDMYKPRFFARQASGRITVLPASP